MGKGKAHKKIEFGNKVGVITTARNCFVLVSKAFHGNPYDGHTIAENNEHAKKMIPGIATINRICVDQGYKKHNYDGDDIEVNIVKRSWRKLPRKLRKWLKRRSSIEPVIGHMKAENRLNRKYLKGKSGDRTNAILSACGFNMRKLLAHIFCAYLKIEEII